MTQLFPYPFDPVTAFNPLKLVVSYVLILLLAGVVASIGNVIYKHLTRIRYRGDYDPTIIDGWVAAVIEELLFRGVPVAIAGFFGWPVVMALFVGHGIWAGLHVRRFYIFLYVFVLGLFFLKFWYMGFSGLWWGAILAHGIHNSIVIYLTKDMDTTPPEVPHRK